MSLMKDVYQSFINVGWSPNQARIMTAEVGRENDFNPKNLFGRHVDASNGKVNLGMISWQGSRGKNLDARLRSKGLVDKSGNIVRSQASLNEMAKFLDTEIKTRPEYKRTKSMFLGNPNVAYDVAKEVVGKNLIGWDYTGSAVLGDNVKTHHAKRDKYYGQLGGKVTGGTMSAQAPSMTNAQKIKVYQAYKSNKMSAVDKAQYESDVQAGVMSMPKNGKLLTTNTPKKAAPQQKGETLPLGVVMAYNNGEMDAGAQAQLDADIRAGIVRAPKGFKLSKPKPKGLVGRSGDKLKAAGETIIDNQFNNGGVANVVGVADAALGVAGGMADMAMEGWSGIGGMAGAAVRGQPIVDGYTTGVDGYRETLPSKALKGAATPRTQTGQSFMDVLGIVDDGIVAAGDASYNATGSPVVGAGVQTGLNALGFIVPAGAKKGRGRTAPIDEAAARPRLTQEELRARVQEGNNGRATNALTRDSGAPVPVRQPTPLDTYNNAMSRSTGDLGGAAARLDGLNNQAARTSADIANLDTTPRPDYSNARPTPAPEVIINRPDAPAPDSGMNPTGRIDPDAIIDADGNPIPDAAPTSGAKIETLLDLDNSKPQTGGVPIDVQGLRAEVLRDLGIPDEGARKGAITGDITQLETEKSLSKLDTEAGLEMREKLDSEYGVMNDYANRIIEDDIGARAGASPESRGQVVIDALDGYKQWYKDQVAADYKKADEVTGGKGGIELTQFASELGKASNWDGKATNQSLRRGIRSYLNEMQLMNKDGTIQPMTARQAESIRQYINSQWSPDSAGLIGKVNESIDMGVFSKLEDSAYLSARGRYQLYKQMFENPKGIGKILDVDGINRKVSPEAVGREMQLLAAKDGAQFKHIYDLLDKVPESIKPQAARAKAEIQASIAESVLGKAGLKTTNKEWMQYRRPNEDGTYKAQAIFGDEIAKKMDTYIAGRNVLQHQDPNPSGTATTARNIDAWNSPENMAGGVVGMAGGLAAGGSPAIAVAAGLAGKAATRKIQNVLNERQSRTDFNESVNPKRAEAYREANEKLVNNVIDTAEMKTILDEFEKKAPNETKIKVFQRKLANTDAWKAYVKTLPAKARKAAINNADVMVMLTQGANSQDDNAALTSF
ncbi:phage tail tip lysozyme [Psychrobacter glaciei]|uniref:phage tail tip lysozyme n=1 Tax=Psychrobacter glaciei TaxID=619771 RepID=UPI003F4537AD